MDRMNPVDLLILWRLRFLVALEDLQNQAFHRCRLHRQLQVGRQVPKVLAVQLSHLNRARRQHHRYHQFPEGLACLPDPAVPWRQEFRAALADLPSLDHRRRRLLREGLAGLKLLDHRLDRRGQCRPQRLADR